MTTAKGILMARERRDRLVQRLCELVGPDVRLVAAQTGWPGLVDVQTGHRLVQLAVYMCPVNRLYRDRRPNDYRILPPGENRPVLHVPGRRTLVVGLWEEQAPVVLVGNPDKWLDRGNRSSQMVKRWALDKAARRGWADYVNEDEDHFRVFQPFLFPVYVAAEADSIDLPTHTATVVEQTWSPTDDSDATRERARRATTALVRDRRFSRDVVAAYGGRCALCDMGLELVDGAHIFPVEAAGSRDVVWNGLCLCPTHHRAFDDHLIWIDPDSRAVRRHPRLAEATVPADRRFVDSTHTVIRLPATADHSPRPDMFRQRYDLYDGSYRWASER